MADYSLSEASKATLSANTTLSQNLGNASNVFTNISSSADADIDNLLASAFQTLRSTGFDGVVGMETEQVQSMISAIDTYVSNVQSALAPLNSADARASFGDTIAPKVEEFVIAVKEACSAVITNMGAFKDDLTAIKTAMESKAASVNTAVGNASNDLTSSKSGWTYTGSGESN